MRIPLSLRVNQNEYQEIGKMDICTLADKNYIKQAELMINSCQDRGDVYFLCLDDETYEHFAGIQGVFCYDLEDINSAKLQYHKKTHTYEQHCWALASYFMNYLQDKVNLSGLLYVDADIYFYSKLTDAITINKSIGIIEHRFKNRQNRNVGHYNVGIIYFANDKIGSECLKWWSDVVLDDSNIWFDEFGSCGDQKYLELFEPLFEDVEVIDVGHAAPWNTHQHYENGYITFQGNKQPLIFYHFSHFALHDSGYVTNRNGEWFPEKTWAKELYDEYWKLCKH